MTISILIAVKTWQKNLENCVAKCLELDYPDFEIIILPDATFDTKDILSRNIPIKVIPTGQVNPADKRDQGLKFAKGEIIAFIDDDAYPDKNWLTCAVENFKDKEVGAVGGPAVTPETDSLRQQASGKIYSSFLVSGNFTYRYIPGPRRKSDDLPSCNLLIRKSVFENLGGFDTKLWPGEDTKLCLDIVHKLGLKIVYDPQVLVYHHRRPVYKSHLKQIANYALHRGYFVKKYPETSLKISYFIPSLFLIGLIFGFVLSVFNLQFRSLYLSSVILYSFLVFVSSINKNFMLFLLTFSGIIFTHLTYGMFFIKGLISGRLKEE